MNFTAQYPFKSMSIGDSFTVTGRFQHCRVAASEFARRNGWVFTCRMSQNDGSEQRSMTVYRVDASQQRVDQRGRVSRRRIPSKNNDPSAEQFSQWLSSFQVGQSYTMPASYGHLYPAMQAWVELASIKLHRSYRSTLTQGELIIQRDA